MMALLSGPNIIQRIQPGNIFVGPGGHGAMSWDDDLGFEVALVSITSGSGSDITLDHQIFNEEGYVGFPVTLTMRILGRVT
jgi:hypothetical protein